MRKTPADMRKELVTNWLCEEPQATEVKQVIAEIVQREAEGNLKQSIDVALALYVFTHLPTDRAGIKRLSFNMFEREK